ncbi:MAG: shikimate kinase [Lachnospiraceae bacterium]|nr:shikimate kinase [Lachnospiraceae bacterium]
MEINKHIFLIGFMGCGKTSVSRELSAQTGINAFDTDELIAESEQMSISEIFRVKGEPYFREKETGLLASMKGQEPLIVSCGGGIALAPRNRELMHESGVTVLLTAEPETILERLKDDDSRPLLAGRKNVPHISSLIDARRPAYEEAADIIIKTDGISPSEISREITELISQL